jgi:hypothetical protein
MYILFDLQELTSTIRLPAEAEAYKVQTIAEGNRYVPVGAAGGGGKGTLCYW